MFDLENLFLFFLLFALLFTTFANILLRKRIKRFKQREKRSASMLEQMSRSKKMESIGRLAGGIAHDFNNMLAGINGSAEVLKTKLEDRSELRRYADVIIETCSKAANLTSQLLMFSRSKGLNSENMDLHKCIEEGLFLLEHGINKNVKIKKRFKADRYYIKSNYDLIQNAILNLGFNSRDAMPGGGTITVSTKNLKLTVAQIASGVHKVDPGEYIEIAFKDTGFGIEENVRYKIFDPFFTTKGIGKGNGLGLPAIYGIVTESSGTIRIKSSDKGTTFFLYFPIVKVKKLPKVKERKTDKITAKVLVVDDDKILLKILKDILELIGVEAITVSSPLDVVAVYKEHKNIDAVMLDVIMPDKGGAEVYRDLKKVNPALLAVFMSGYNKDPAVEEIIKNEKGVEFLGKPYKIADVSQKLKRLLSKN